MSQSEPPADTAIELARRSPLIPPGTPAARSLSSFGFLHYAIKGTPASNNIVLGDRYSSVVLETAANREVEGWPVPEMVRQLMLAPTPLERRMMYRWLLEQELDLAQPGSQREIWLQNERRLWLLFDFEEMDDKLDRGLEVPLKTTLNISPREHWYWMIPLVRGHATPTTASWRGMKHVPVHRLLWPMVFPRRPFRSNPQREVWCQEKLCVNPNHFYDPSERPSPVVDGPGRGYESDKPTGTRIRWHVEDVVVLPDGTRTIVCPECGERTRDRRNLEIVNDPVLRVPPKGGQMYCWNCYQIWKQKVLGLGPRQRRMPDRKRLETRTERFQREFKTAQEREAREAQGLSPDKWGDASGSDDWKTRIIDDPDDPA